MNTIVVTYQTEAQYDVFKAEFKGQLEGVTIVPASPDLRLFGYITRQTLLLFLPGWRNNRRVPDLIWGLRAYSNIPKLELSEDQMQGRERICWPD